MNSIDTNEAMTNIYCTIKKRFDYDIFTIIIYVFVGLSILYRN